MYCSCEDDWKPNNQNLVPFNSFENSNLEIGEHSFKNCYFVWNYDSQIPINFQLYKLQNYVDFA